MVNIEVKIAGSLACVEQNYVERSIAGLLIDLFKSPEIHFTV